MTSRVLQHRKLPDGRYRLLVWTDDSKLEEDGSPSPEYVREFLWVAAPKGVKQADYVESQLREAKLLIEAEAEAAGTKLASEDTVL